MHIPPRTDKLGDYTRRDLCGTRGKRRRGEGTDGVEHAPVVRSRNHVLDGWESVRGIVEAKVSGSYPVSVTFSRRELTYRDAGLL